jgi:hypothetical protein
MTSNLPKKVIVIVGVFLMCHLFFTVAIHAAGVPYTLNYQGYLTDSQGQPIRTPKNITIRLYNTSSGDTATAFWTEPYSQVSVNNGRFSLVLGSNSANPFNPTKFTGETYIGIQVECDSHVERLCCQYSHRLGAL